MISDEFEAFGDNYSYAGKLKPKYLFKKLLVFKNPEYSFKTNIHLLKLVQKVIHFFNPNYSFKKYITFLKEAVSPRARISRRSVNISLFHN